MYTETCAASPDAETYDTTLAGRLADGTTPGPAGTNDRAPDAAGPEAAARSAGDWTEFSEAALAAFRKAAIEPIKHGTFSLDRLEQRINVVRAEIHQLRCSALPDEEKDRQVEARKNEIALLQAGQFTFAKAGFPLTI